MGKGKKKTKGKKKREGKKLREETGVDDSSTFQLQLDPAHMERARLAAANRKEDPLKNWTRLLNQECPICMLPLPWSVRDTHYCVTCGKTVCKGCLFGSAQVHKRDGTDRETAIEKIMACSFCRSSLQPPVKAMLEKTMRLANAGQHEGMYRLATYYCKGQMGLQQDIAEGVKWYHRAIEAGSGKAAYDLGVYYNLGDEEVEQDIEQSLEYHQKSADLGYSPAFVMIGTILMTMGEIEEAMLNFRKAASKYI